MTGWGAESLGSAEGHLRGLLQQKLNSILDQTRAFSFDCFSPDLPDLFFFVSLYKWTDFGV